MSQGVAEFFGVNDEPQAEREKRVERWRERSRRMHGNSMFLGGHKIADDECDDLSFGVIIFNCFIYSIPLICCYLSLSYKYMFNE